MSGTLENIWDEFAARLRQFIRGRVGDAATAEDILQDVFLKVHTRASRLADPVKLQGWLYTIARHAIIDHYRARKPTVSVPDSLAAEPEADEPDMEGLKMAIRRMLDSLPKPYREALVLTELEGLTQKELAQRLGISLSGAKSRVQRGRAQLKAMLQECCRFQFDRRGRVIDCEPRSEQGCCK